MAAQGGPNGAATVLKDQGNLAFKAGDFARAVEHYSAAMKADPSDAIMPCNRSMAHLKMKMWREAARDATRSLELQPTGNSKALFRRGLARKGLGDLNAAKPDFEAALALDPANKSILAELDQLSKQVPHMPHVPSVKPVEELPPAPKPPFGAEQQPSPAQLDRLRAAIAPGSSSAGSELLREVSTTRKGQAAVVPAATGRPAAMELDPPAAAPIGGFADLKRARQARQASRTGVQPVPGPAASSNLATPRPVASAPIGDFTDFERRWTSVKSIHERQSVLQALPRSSLGRLFGEHLEPEMLDEIVRAVTDPSSSQAPPFLLDERLHLLESLSTTPRFDLLTMFLTNDTRDGLRRMLSDPAVCNRPDAARLAQLWDLVS